MRGQIQKVLESEENHKDRIVAYHALPFNISVVMDILSTLRSILAQKKSFAYRFDSAFKEINDWMTYFESTYHQKGGWTFEKDRVICANPALFSSENIEPESTFHYWSTNTGASDPDFYTIFSPVLRAIGLPEGLYKDYESFYKKAKEIMTPSGRLLQFFINPEYADSVGFVFWPRTAGTHHPKTLIPLQKASDTSDLAKESPTFKSAEEASTFEKEFIGDQGNIYLTKQDSPPNKHFKLSSSLREIMAFYRQDPLSLDKILKAYDEANKTYLEGILENAGKGSTSDSKDEFRPLYNLKMFHLGDLIKKMRLKSQSNSINTFQMRILIKPEVMNNPDVVSIMKHWALPQDLEKEKEYKKKFYDLVSRQVNLLLHTGMDSDVTLEKGPSSLLRQTRDTTTTSPVGRLDLEPEQTLRTMKDHCQILEWIRKDNADALSKYFSKDQNKPYVFSPLLCTAAGSESARVKALQLGGVDIF